MPTTKGPIGDEPGRHDPRGAAADRDPNPMKPSVRAAPEGESCADCRFFLGDVDDTNGTGQCHRNAPSPMASGWPVVLGSDWCGEYEAAPAPASRKA